jgi:pimeloyl-ACP methyl ester carboxylesterase
LVLIAPSSLISNLGVLLFILSFLLFPTPSRGEKLLRKSFGLKVDKQDDFLSLMKLAAQTMPKVAIPKVISNNQLRRITTPIKFILGEKDKPINLKTMIKKIQRCIPYAQIAVAKNSGHAMIIEASHFLDAEILKFLQE